MNNKTINISLPSSMADFIQKEVKRGEYVSMSDFFRSLVRKYQFDRGMHTTEDVLRNAVRIGLESGEGAALNMDAVIRRAQAPAK